MPKQGWEGFGELVGDLWRELSPIVRGGVFTGFGLGVLTTVYYMAFGPSTGVWFVPLSPTAAGFLLCLLFMPAFLGAFAGCVVGVVLEMILGKGGSSRGRKGR
jgi:hypothetical protein